MEKQQNKKQSNKNTKSYSNQEKDPALTNLSQVLTSSKYQDKDNEDM
ncbi:hypothetical protein H8S33_13370 [Ornithinibacillus sp. BX22]|uniref:Uncharacterized protein n=1 Tax=Ornithinibacillus hominis TaxID=2763055 RepID=A0A923L7D1_9BACI|nr:hypothetical protein [Ornithinibacillus hominis]MBC5637799.1 hypothetical protein [Ornithinibacillus hominis]